MHGTFFAPAKTEGNINRFTNLGQNYMQTASASSAWLPFFISIGRSATLVAAVLLLAISSAHATSPVAIYTGQIEENGSPMNATVDVTFEFFSSATGGRRVWHERHQNIQVVNGQYRVFLGAKLKNRKHRRALTQSITWLQVKLAGEPLGHRRPFYANAQHSDDSIERSMAKSNSTMVARVYRALGTARPEPVFFVH